MKLEVEKRVGPAEHIGVLGVLDDDVRRRLYETISASRKGLTRQELAESAGIKPSLAAYHLERLVDSGLVSVSRERLSGRTGPGAGRPANLYTRSEREVNVSLPPRDYPLLAGLLAEAIAGDRDGRTVDILREAARRAGRIAADEAESSPGTARERLTTLLEQRGYEPVADRDGTIRLTNCPFHLAAREQPEVVCGLNEELLAGMIDGLAEAGMTAELDPSEGYCCVVIRPAGTGTDR